MRKKNASVVFLAASAEKSAHKSKQPSRVQVQGILTLLAEEPRTLDFLADLRRVTGRSENREGRRNLTFFVVFYKSLVRMQFIFSGVFQNGF